MEQTKEEELKELANFWCDAAQEAYRWRDINADRIKFLEAENAELKAEIEKLKNAPS